MNIHYLRHVEFEGLGCIKEWAKVPGNRLTATKFYEDNKLPFVELFDLLIVMGGPMGVYDESQYPWMKKEKELIAKAIDKNKKVLGICLGAQLIADVLGAKVYKNKEKEIGWLPVELTEEGKSNGLFSDFQQHSTVFQWHGDTFDIPSGAKRIATSEACENQGFIYGDNVVALQFHLEVRLPDIEKLIANCGHELVQAPYIQTAEELRKEDYITSSNEMILNFLNKFVK
jgi:GMP synthase-like glutamine amidotransferase